MSAYNERLAEDILVALNEKFPAPINSDELKRQPRFVSVSQHDWTRALEALLQVEHINGQDIRSGDKGLQGILRCVITSEGRTKVRPVVSWKGFYRKWIERFGEELYKKKRIGKLVSALGAATLALLAGRDTALWINSKNALIVALLVAGAWALGRFYPSAVADLRRVGRKRRASTTCLLFGWRSRGSPHD